ncbi:phage GP46 family protein [Aliivibrio logei]|uniref:phage GP46 family protein n=1 Tax=Aliivibrio logei TaxID=688 RepID=UPI0035C92048
MSYFTLNALTAPMTSIEGLTHAVLQSVLNHAESTQNDRARMENSERGGCWSDEFVHGVGSRDWTLKREKLTEQTMIRAKRFYEEALAWLVDEMHVKAVTVEVFKLTPKQLGRRVTLTLNDGANLEVPL